MGIRETKKERTRNALLEAARLLFAEKGYQGATTAEIAARCGLAEGTLFNYYRSKADLFAAALVRDELSDAGAARLPAVGEPRLGPVAAAIGAYIAAKLRDVAATPKPLLRELFALLYGGARSDSDAARERLLAVDSAMAEDVRVYLASYAGSDPTSRFDAALAAECIYRCVLSGLFLYALDDEMPFDVLIERFRAQIAFMLAGHLPD